MIARSQMLEPKSKEDTFTFEQSRGWFGGFKKDTRFFRKFRPLPLKGLFRKCFKAFAKGVVCLLDALMESLAIARPCNG